MGGKFRVGQLGGIPIVLDQSFILLVSLLGYHYWNSASGSNIGSGQSTFAISGAFVAIGCWLSILLHEFAHAWAGRVCGIPTSHIELHGLGGLCFLEREANDEQQSIFISLIGPASNLALWALFHWLTLLLEIGIFEDYLLIPSPRDTAAYHVWSTLWLVLSGIAYANLAMFILNIMPAFPLDGGRALASWLRLRHSPANAESAVAYLGFLVCIGLVWYGIKFNPFALVLAVWLFLDNWRALQAANDQRRTRRN